MVIVAIVSMTWLKEYQNTFLLACGDYISGISECDGPGIVSLGGGGATKPMHATKKNLP